MTATRMTATRVIGTSETETRMPTTRRVKRGAGTKTYYQRKRESESAWVEVTAWVIVGLGVLLLVYA